MSSVLTESLQVIFDHAAKAVPALQGLNEEIRADILRALAKKLEEKEALVLTENSKDLLKMADSDPKKDRLVLSSKRIQELVSSLYVIAALPDPSGKRISYQRHVNGLEIEKKTVPLGVVGVIFESRPNVTIDVAALCIRSGNVCILRGGTDAFYTNTVLVELIREVLTEKDLNPDFVQLMPPEREFIKDLLQADRYIDIIIPRGSQELINYVKENSSIPVIETGAGVCHTYVEKTANLEMAERIVKNAKISRPSVCNSLDTILIDSAVAEDFLTILAADKEFSNVELFADATAFSILNKLGYPLLQKAGESDFGREFLDYKCSVKVVENAEEAIEHIRRHSSKHSEAIITSNAALMERFLNEIDAAAVFVNASTRFTDGAEFGLGAEIGISTQKLHARGPFALEKLVTEKWLVRGNGQVR